MKMIKAIHIVGTLALSTSALGIELNKSCNAELSKELPACKKISPLKGFTVQSKKYLVAHVECLEDEVSTAQYTLLEIKNSKECRLLDSDTSFIDYMYGVDADLKSKSPIAVFENAIKAELAHQLKNKNEITELVEKYRKRSTLGELTKDQQWVLKYLEGELKK